MPCFKGLAVSIHADGPLDEYAMQKQSRQNRISSYIAVPPARVPADSLTGKPEQPGFAISITLLTPGLNVPYSQPKASPEDPFPRHKTVGGLPGYGGDRGKYGSVIPPYVPRTTNPNETIAAYIYFDGRAKEEVATLLRRGEETWVNSRWVSVPESEGGGLAEREFLFREVGLERWLNGLDLEGSKDKAERIEKRQKKLEKRRQKRREQLGLDSEDEDGVTIKREGENGSRLDEDIMQDDSLLTSDDDSDDEPPQPETAGQIKVALFRVLASGEVKRGEYEPQFDAHDDEEGAQNGDSGNGDQDVDHTTSFAKPKTLDPKSISTQTVTGLDPAESPYAVFTFFYRGEKQLRKMGILRGAEVEKKQTPAKRKSAGSDFSKLGPLNKFGTVGFSGYRDNTNGKSKTRKSGGDAMDSDDDEDDKINVDDDDVEVKREDGGLLSPEDAIRQDKIAEGVQKIKLKRQASAEPLSEPAATRKSPHLNTTDSPSASTPQSVNSTSANAGTPPPEKGASSAVDPTSAVASPFKRHRASMPGMDGTLFAPLGAGGDQVYPPTSTAAPSASAPQPQQPTAPGATAQPPAQQQKQIDDEDEEL